MGLLCAGLGEDEGDDEGEGEGEGEGEKEKKSDGDGDGGGGEVGRYFAREWEWDGMGWDGIVGFNGVSGVDG